MGKSARNKRFALKRSLCLNADSGLLGNVETHAIKMKINTPNTVATAKLFVFKLTIWQFEDCAEEEERGPPDGLYEL